jgi:Holliday junction resolvasome RuvABC endonuclease subunit
MNVLALDLGTRTGYAIYKEGTIIGGTQKLRHCKNASGLRFVHFRRWLIATIATHNIYSVFFERVVRHKGTAAAHVYGGFMYMLAAVCEEMQIKCTGLPVGMIKKFMTGKGNATKDEMIAAAKLRGFNPIDDNAADALAILLTGLNTLNFQQKCGSCFAIEGSGARSPDSSLASEVF